MNFKWFSKDINFSYKLGEGGQRADQVDRADQERSGGSCKMCLKKVVWTSHQPIYLSTYLTDLPKLYYLCKTFFRKDG